MRRRRPKARDITEGKWWPANYTGPDADLLRRANSRTACDLKLGDTITLNVLGREITGKIANFRDVDFSNGQQNFILILSPGLIDKAPHDFLATVRVDAARRRADVSRRHRQISRTSPPFA